MKLFLAIAVILITARIATFLAEKANVPSVVALIFAGILLGLPWSENVLIEPNTEVIFRIGDIGLLVLMFLAGLETSWRKLFEEKRDAMFIAVFAAAIPFFIGFIVFRFMGYSTATALVVGICMSITAEATKAKVLLELRKLRTRLGAAMMGAGIVDDTLGLILFVAVGSLLHEAGFKENLLTIGAILCFFTGMGVQRIAGRETQWLNRGSSQCPGGAFFLYRTGAAF